MRWFSVTASLAMTALALVACPEAQARDLPFERVTDVRSGEAIVYIYRQRKLMGAAAALGVTVNGVSVAKLWSGHYVAVAVPAGNVSLRALAVAAAPGDLKFTLSDVTEVHEAIYYLWWTKGIPVQPLQFTVLAGQEYFVEVALGYRLTQQTAEAAMPVLSKSELFTGRAPFANESLAKQAAELSYRTSNWAEEMAKLQPVPTVRIPQPAVTDSR